MINFGSKGSGDYRNTTQNIILKRATLYKKKSQITAHSRTDISRSRPQKKKKALLQGIILKQVLNVQVKPAVYEPTVRLPKTISPRQIYNNNLQGTHFVSR